MVEVEAVLLKLAVGTALPPSEHFVKQARGANGHAGVKIRDYARGLAGAQARRAVEDIYGHIFKGPRRILGLLHTKLAQLEARQPAVEYVSRIVNVCMADK